MNDCNTEEIDSKLMNDVINQQKQRNGKEATHMNYKNEMLLFDTCSKICLNERKIKVMLFSMCLVGAVFIPFYKKSHFTLDPLHNAAINKTIL